MSEARASSSGATPLDEALRSFPVLDGLRLLTLLGPAWAAEAPPSATDQVAAPAAKEKEARHESERHEQKPQRFDWSFAGAFGRYDKAQLRRGFKVYKEVCSSCHSIKMLAFRNLSQPGGPEFSEKEVEELAASYKIKDGPNEAGEYFDRPGRPSDRFPPPFANEQAARAALAGNYPPDMSVLAKARGYSRGFPLFLFDALPGFSYQEHGVDYIVSLMEGYRRPAAGRETAGWTVLRPLYARPAHRHAAAAFRRRR